MLCADFIFPISHRVIICARIGVPSFASDRLGAIACPRTESGPMGSELIVIRTHAPHNDIIVTPQEGRLLRVGDPYRRSVVISGSNPWQWASVGVVGKDQTSSIFHMRGNLIKGRSCVARQNIYPYVCLGVLCNAFASILNLERNIAILWNLSGKIGNDPNPRTFRLLKVGSQVLPLVKRCDRIADGEEDTRYFQYLLPPVKGIVPGFLGILCIFSGWLNLRSGRTLPWSGIVLVSGCILWGFACLALLPWLVEFHF